MRHILLKAFVVGGVMSQRRIVVRQEAAPTSNKRVKELITVDHPHKPLLISVLAQHQMTAHEAYWLKKLRMMDQGLISQLINKESVVAMDSMKWRSSAYIY